MLQQPLYSLFIRLIPEAFLIMYAICKLTNSVADFKKILLSSLIAGIGVYVTRLFPIHFGVHTILAVLFDILLAVKLNNINIHKAIKGSLVSVILLFSTDLIFVAIYTGLHLTSAITGQSLLSVIAGIPSLIMFYIIVRMITYFKFKRTVHEQN